LVVFAFAQAVERWIPMTVNHPQALEIATFAVNSNPKTKGSSGHILAINRVVRVLLLSSLYLIIRNQVADVLIGFRVVDFIRKVRYFTSTNKPRWRLLVDTISSIKRIKYFFGLAN
jgi:hypothetical protein